MRMHICSGGKVSFIPIHKPEPILIHLHTQYTHTHTHAQFWPEIIANILWNMKHTNSANNTSSSFYFHLFYVINKNKKSNPKEKRTNSKIERKFGGPCEYCDISHLSHRMERNREKNDSRKIVR